MMTDSSQPLAVGSTLGQFVIQGSLGAGGMGEVYEAEDTRLHRRVALKVVRSEVASDPVRRARLEREASAVARLNHPNIVTVHSLDEHDGILFITMELIEGSTLSAALPRKDSHSIDCCPSPSSWSKRSARHTVSASCTAI